jgi:hypothetical protein
MERAGVPQLPVDEALVRGGSLLALPKLALPYGLPAALRDMMVPLRSVSLPVRSPIRTLGVGVPAAFYSTGWGLIPFSISREDPEGLEISQVHYLVSELPAARSIGGDTKPWPGYVDIGGNNVLALLVPAATSIVYPWNIDVPARLEVLCGVAPGFGPEEGGSSYDFEVRQLGADGRTMASARESIAPGEPPARRWRRLTLPLEAGGGGRLSLELRFTSSDRVDLPVGAYAAPLILNRDSVSDQRP